MREIKFRAWWITERIMLHNVHLFYEYLGDKSTQYNLKKHGNEYEPEEESFGHLLEGDNKDDYVVMQYTGLKDKSGKEIYEGDIVVQDGYIWFDEDKPNYRGVVEWVFSGWQVIAHCVNEDKRGISDGMNYLFNDEGEEEGANSTWIVLGNIYETPDLLPHQTD